MMSTSFRFRQYPVERNHFSTAQAVLGTAARTWHARCTSRERARPQWRRSERAACDRRSGYYGLCTDLNHFQRLGLRGLRRDFSDRFGFDSDHRFGARDEVTSSLRLLVVDEPFHRALLLCANRSSACSIRQEYTDPASMDGEAQASGAHRGAGEWRVARLCSNSLPRSGYHHFVRAR
jgi:hypothetical protein